VSALAQNITAVRPEKLLQFPIWLIARNLGKPHKSLKLSSKTVNKANRQINKVEND
jgi:hypothetical protein